MTPIGFCYWLHGIKTGLGNSNVVQPNTWDEIVLRLKSVYSGPGSISEQAKKIIDSLEAERMQGEEVFAKKLWEFVMDAITRWERGEVLTIPREPKSWEDKVI